MLDTLLEVTDDRRGLFVREMVSLITGGVAERARSSLGLGAAQTVADACKLASILFAVLWLTALAQHAGPLRWRSHPQPVLVAIGLILTTLSWLLGRERAAGALGVAVTIALLGNRGPFSIPAPILLMLTPMSGFVMMLIAPARKRPSPVAAVGLAALVVLSALVVPGTAGGARALLVLSGATMLGLLVFVVQPRLAIAVAIVWTTIGAELIASGESLRSPFTLLVVAAPAVLAATAARAQIIRRGTT